ncbi:MAG: hypothetical protein RR653_07680 [Clostridia bacterium]
MKHIHLTRILAFVLCLCLLPFSVLAEEAAETEAAAVTRSDFSLAFNLHASGFPDDGMAHYAGWEKFLGKISLQGVVDTQRFLQPQSRVYFNGGLYLNNQLTVPFEYDGYHSYRYLRTPALGGASMHFQMHNFFEFMLKPYYFMDLPTPYLALLLYPEASYFVKESYYDPIALLCEGTGNRTVAYADLYELCETLDLLVTDDPDYERMYFYITSLLVDLQASDMTLEALGCLEDWLDYLDPEQEGLQITSVGHTETYVLGTTKLFEKTVKDGATDFTLNLPNNEGYALVLQALYSPKEVGADITAKLTATIDGKTQVDITLDLVGLPKQDEQSATGRATLVLGGEAFGGTSLPLRFDFRYAKNSKQGNLQSPPYHVTLDADFLHPLTERPAVSMHYAANVSSQPEKVLVERPYDNQDDFFHLNESYLEEYMDRFVPTLALAFFPFLLEMPVGVMNDAFTFLTDTGILAALGIE